MSHNLEFTNIRQKKRCIECGKKARTIYQPNDKGTYSRTASYRIICENCNITFLVHTGIMNEILEKYEVF